MAKPIVNKFNTNKLGETICNVHQAQRTENIKMNNLWTLGSGCSLCQHRKRWFVKDHGAK